MNKKNSIKHNSVLHKACDRRGMSVAEMLITVAIIVILAGVGFIAVSQYQRSLAQTERDGVAKELFIAAQNHLTMTRGEGYLGVANEKIKANGNPNRLAELFGYTDTAGGASQSRYIVVTKGQTSKEGSGDNIVYVGADMFDVMLPFGSIDETVRAGGSFIVRYQPESGKVMDVFYCTASGEPERFNHVFSEAEYTELCELTGDANKRARREYGNDKSVVGWYGGAEAAKLQSTSVTAASIEVENSDTLNVTLKDPNAGADYKLIITGLTSGAKKAVDLDKDDSRKTYDSDSKEYKYVLDDITKDGMHFAELGQDTTDKFFIAGEDIRIEAMAYSKSALCNIEFSDAKVVNSLYDSIADPEGTVTNPYDSGEKMAFISSIRHLENLEEYISNTGRTGKNTSGNKSITFVSASQTADLDWNGFKTNTGGTQVFRLDGVGVSQEEGGGYCPVSYDSALVYDGLRHSISNVETVFNGEAGLFGTLEYGSKVSNLELVDFDVRSKLELGKSYAGALAGRVKNAAVTNVIAYNSPDKEALKVESAEGYAGGLIGYLNGGTVKYCGAALIVESGGSAGGLIGSSDSSSKVEACYSGGHTVKGVYDDEHFNVTASTAAGGLIGTISTTVITDSYSTCSAKAGVAGGLVGSVSGETASSIKNSYSTGLTDGGSYAFAGDGGDKVSFENCYYLDIINEIKADDDKSIEGYKKPVNAEKTVFPFDTMDDDEGKRYSYESFVGPEAQWNDAQAYDAPSGTDTLKKYYGEKYPFRTVTQLEAGHLSNKARIDPVSNVENINAPGSLFVNTHYGDWPAPEIFIINER